MVLCAIGLQWWVMSLASQRLLALRSAAGAGAFEKEVDVIASEMVPGEQAGEPVLAIVGRLRNGAEEALRIAVLEVQFTDAAGRLVDVGRLDSWYIRPLTIPPDREAAFRLVAPPELPMNRYAAHTVFVRATSPADSLF